MLLRSIPAENHIREQWEDIMSEKCESGFNRFTLVAGVWHREDSASHLQQLDFVGRTLD